VDVLARYQTPEGERELVLVSPPDARHPHALIDALAGRGGEGADVRVIEHELDSRREAQALAHDYAARSAELNAPANDYSPWA